MHPNDTTSARRLQGWRGEALRIGFALLLLMGFRSAFANHYLVPTGSMQPTLMPGDRVLVDMRAYGYRLPFTHARLLGQGQPTRGEVAVFRSPADGERLIKRIVAVGGDRVEVRDGHLRINGRDVALGGHADVEQLGRHVYRLDLSRGGGPGAGGAGTGDGRCAGQQPGRPDVRPAAGRCVLCPCDRGVLAQRRRPRLAAPVSAVIRRRRCRRA